MTGAIYGHPAGDEEEWRDWKRVGDPVMHIELRRWADCLVIAPLSANTLAKLAQGFCDNLLTCLVSLLFSPSTGCPIAGLRHMTGHFCIQVRAWDFDRPLVVAPAMNTFMWESPFTAAHLGVLQKLGVSCVPPVGIWHALAPAYMEGALPGNA